MRGRSLAFMIESLVRSNLNKFDELEKWFLEMSNSDLKSFMIGNQNLSKFRKKIKEIFKELRPKYRHIVN